MAPQVPRAAGNGRKGSGQWTVDSGQPGKVKDPRDNAEQIANSFARLLPTLVHATSLITTEQRAFLRQIAAHKGCTSTLSDWLINRADTQAEGLFLRRVLLALPDATKPDLAP